MNSKSSNKIIAILAVLLILAVAFYIRAINKKELLEHQLAAKNSENVQYRNKNGQLVSEKLAYEGTKKDLKAEAELWKAKGDTLSTKVTAQTQAIILLKKTIDIIGSGKPLILPGKTDTVVMVDTIRIDTPTYVINETDKFRTFQFAGNKSKYAYKMSVTDDTELSMTDAGKGGTLVTAINKNPYVTSSEAKTLLVPKKPISLLHKVAHAVAGIAIFWLLVTR